MHTCDRYLYTCTLAVSAGRTQAGLCRFILVTTGRIGPIAALRERQLSAIYLPQVMAKVEMSFTPKAVKALFHTRSVAVAVLNGEVIDNCGGFTRR